jgi:hypothetical protein
VLLFLSSTRVGRKCLCQGQIIFPLGRNNFISSYPGADSFSHLLAAAASLASCFVWCGEERRGGQQEGENRRRKKDVVEPLQDLFDPLQIQVSTLKLVFRL